MVPGGPNFNTHLWPPLTKGSRSQKLKGSACKSRELCGIEEITWLEMLVLRLLHCVQLEDGTSS